VKKYACSAFDFTAPREARRLLLLRWSGIPVRFENPVDLRIVTESSIRKQDIPLPEESINPKRLHIFTAALLKR